MIWYIYCYFSKDDHQSMNDQLSVEKKSKTKLARTNTELIQQTVSVSLSDIYLIFF